MKTLKLNILLLISAASLGSCNNQVDDPLPPCDPDVIGQNTEFYFSKTGTLTLIDTIPHFVVSVPIYIINSKAVPFTLLEPCNLPDGKFNIAIGDTIDILFSGNLMHLSPTGSSAGIFKFELYKIQKL